MKKIVIIGGGMAGYLTAMELHKHDLEYTLTLITTDSGDYYAKPALSFALAQGKSPADLVLHTRSAMEAQYDMTVHAHTTVVRIDTDNKSVVTNDAVIDYDYCILATGSDAVPFPTQSDLSGKLLSVNSLDDYRTLISQLNKKQHVAVIGSGLVGVEFAHDLVSDGYQVSVICVSNKPLDNFVPADIGDALQQSMQQLGVQWHLNTLVNNLQEHAGGVLLTLDNGSTVQADIVLSAIGIQANTTLAKASGIEVGKGVVVDAYCQTSCADVYAIGDCAEVLGMQLFYVPPIRQCAAALAQTLAGSPTAVTYPAMPVTVKSPSCPVVSCPPRTMRMDDLTLEVTGTFPSFTAIYRDATGVMQGFALSGDAVAQKMVLAKQISVWR